MFKKIIKRIVYKKMINILLRMILKPFHTVIPLTILHRIPIIGVFSLPLLHSMKLYLDVTGLNICTSTVYWRGLEAYESETQPVFFKLLENVDVFIDIGANVGLYTLMAAIENQKRKVYAFEPDPEVFSYLIHNIALNKLDNVFADRNAVTSYDGEIILYLRPGISSSTHHIHQGSRSVLVPASTLDSFVVRHNISRVDLIKIDTEGTEPDILASAQKILVTNHPFIICEVLKGFTEAALHDVLDPIDYRYFWISDRGLIEKKRIEGDRTWKNLNYLFIHKKKLDSIMELFRGKIFVLKN